MEAGTTSAPLASAVYGREDFLWWSGLHRGGTSLLLLLLVLKGVLCMISTGYPTAVHWDREVEGADGQRVRGGG